jgi:Flp pilus assembly protein TadD
MEKMPQASDLIVRYETLVCIALLLSSVPIEAQDVAVSDLDPQSYLHAADAALRDGRLTQAAQMIAWLDSNGAAVSRDDVALLKAEYAIATHDIEKAAAALVSIHDVERNFCRAHTAKGWVSGNRGQVDQAIIALAKASKSCPDDAGIWNLLGLAFVKKGETVAAGEAFRKAMMLAPDEAEVLNNHALSLLQNGEAELAYRQLQIAAAKAYDNELIQGNLDFVGGMIGRSPERRDGENDAQWSGRLVSMGKGAKAAANRPQADALFSQALLTLDHFDSTIWAELAPAQKD